MADSSQTADSPRPTPLPKPTLTVMDVMNQLHKLQHNTTQQFSDVQKDLTFLQGQYDKLQADHDLLQEDHSSLKKHTAQQFSDFREDMTILQCKYDKLQADHNLLQREHQKLGKDHNNLVQKHDQLLQNQDTVHGEYQSLRLYLDTFHEEHQSIVTDHQRMEEDVGKVNDVAKEMMSRLSNLAEENDSQLQGVRSELQGIVTDHQMLKEDVGKVSDVTRGMTSELRQLTNERETLHSKLTLLENHGNVQEEMATSDAQLHAEIENLKHVAETSNAKQEKLHAEIQNLRHGMDKTTDYLPSMKEDRGKITKDVTTITARHDHVDIDKESINTERKKMDDELQRVKAEQENMKKEIQSTQKEQKHINDSVQRIISVEQLAVAELKYKMGEAMQLFSADRPVNILRKGDNPVPFPVLHYNHGGHFNAHTGRFVAPQEGMYSFFVRVSGDFKENFAEFYVMTERGDSFLIAYRPGEVRSERVMFPLSAGQHVWMAFPKSVEGEIGWSFVGAVQPVIP